MTGRDNAPLVIISAPQNGTVQNNGDGTLTITLNPNDTDKFALESFVYIYEDTKGNLVEGKKDFVVTQEGDVPSLIQTGGDTPPPSNTPGNLMLLITLLFVGATLLRRRELGGNES